MYRIYRIPKKNGKWRTIMEPEPDLKEKQWQLKEVLDLVPLHFAAHGFVRNKSIVTNAQIHKQQRYVLNIDIKDFFPSVLKKPLIEYLDTIHVVKAIVPEIEEHCFWEGKLPQGAPTSPVLANIYMIELDEMFQTLATGYEWQYTRYADDMTFSGGDEVKDYLPMFLRFVDFALAEYSLHRNVKKTKLMPYYQRQLVTGVVVNNERLTLPRWLKEELFQELKGKPWGELTEERKGFLEHVRNVDERFFTKLCGLMPESPTKLMLNQ